MKLINLLIIASILSACAQTPDVPKIKSLSELTSIETKYTNELASIKVGDYIKDIKQKFPELQLVSDTMKNTIYETYYNQDYVMASSTKAQTIKRFNQRITFYFINRKLVHWQAK